MEGILTACVDGQFKCYDGNCISVLDTCDGLPHCLYGEDESDVLCSNRLTEASSSITSGKHHSTDDVATSTERMSLPMIVTIASVCVFTCILIIIFVVVYVANRHKNNTSRDSQSASEPLRKSYITTYTESDVDTPTQRKRAPYQADSNFRSRDHINYLPVESQNHMIANHDAADLEIAGRDSASPTNTSPEVDNEQAAGKPNLAIQSGVEIYNVNPLDSPRVHDGLGKYTFKPRLKYLNSVPYNEIGEKDRDKLYVINSYRHCLGKSIVPSILTFDKDPVQFSDQFATDLLCSSTPRQHLRRLVKVDHCPTLSCENIPSIDEC
ncbi:hypothetical protein ACF0H5_006424 [Mactra antiquata]